MPFCSVMIPIFNRTKFLTQALESVLSQNFEKQALQICIVDNSTQEIEWNSILDKYELGRVEIFKNEKHLPGTVNFNHLIALAKGEWVHILHDDDWILPGFYQTIEKYADRYPAASLIATRSFGVDEQGVIEWLTPRLRDLENCGNDAHDFYYQTPIQCPGVVVKRNFYENHGGFRLDMDFVSDCEMWARAVSMGGGVITPEILACYRTYNGNGTSRLMRTAENLYSIHRLNQLFAERYPTFDYNRALIQLLDRAHRQAEEFSRAGDNQAAQLSFDFWREHALKKKPLRRVLGKIKRSIFS